MHHRPVPLAVLKINLVLVVVVVIVASTGFELGNILGMYATGQCSSRNSKLT